jgi:hypothetical protein
VGSCVVMWQARLQSFHASDVHVRRERCKLFTRNSTSHRARNKSSNCATSCAPVLETAKSPSKSIESFIVTSHNSKAKRSMMSSLL